MPVHQSSRAPSRRWSLRFNKIWKSTPPQSPLQFSEPTLQSTTTQLTLEEGEHMYEKSVIGPQAVAKPRVGPRSSSLSTVSNTSVLAFLNHERGDCDSLAALPELTELYESSNTTSMSPHSLQLSCDPMIRTREMEFEQQLREKDLRIQELQNINKTLEGQLAMANTSADATKLEAKMTIVEYRAALERLKEQRMHELKMRNSIQVCQTVRSSSTRTSPQSSSRHLPAVMAQALSEDEPLTSPLETARAGPSRPMSSMSRARGLRPILPITG